MSHVRTSSGTYLLDLVAGADSLAPGRGDLVGLLDGGRLIVVVVMVAPVDDVIGSHQRVRFVHPGVLSSRIVASRIIEDSRGVPLWPIETTSDRSRCERERYTAARVCFLSGHQPSDFGARRKTFTERRNYSGN